MTTRQRQAAVKLGRDLRKWREDAGWTQAEAARWAGVKQWTISRIEAGRCEAAFAFVVELFNLYVKERRIRVKR